MAKSGPAIRAFVSPLQTTLMKVINDSELSEPLQSVILKNMGELVKLMMKTDSVRAELLTTLKSPSISVHSTALGVLALIGNQHGATMKPDVRTALFSQIAMYLSKLATPADGNLVASLSFAMMSLCHINQEAYALLDLAVGKYFNRQDISNYLLFAMLFSQFGLNEVGGKFINSLIGKVNFPDKISLGKSMPYAKLFISGISGPALEEILKISGNWIIGLEAVEWDICNHPQ